MYSGLRVCARESGEGYGYSWVSAAVYFSISNKFNQEIFMYNEFRLLQIVGHARILIP